MPVIFFRLFSFIRILLFTCNYISHQYFLLLFVRCVIANISHVPDNLTTFAINSK